MKPSATRSAQSTDAVAARGAARVRLRRRRARQLGARTVPRRRRGVAGTTTARRRGDGAAAAAVDTAAAAAASDDGRARDLGSASRAARSIRGGRGRGRATVAGEFHVHSIL